MRDCEKGRAEEEKGVAPWCGCRATKSFRRKKSKIRAMTILRYRILLRKEDDGTYTVIVPSLPGCLTFGHTVEEALEMAKEAIEGFIECMIARGEEVPVETDEAMICTVAIEANA